MGKGSLMLKTGRFLRDSAFRAVENLYNWCNVYFQARSRKVLPFTGQCQRILEIGGGDRITWTRRLARRGEFVAVAELEHSKALAASRLAKRAHTKLENVAWVVADATNLPFGDLTFDTVLCIDVIEHVPDDNGLLSQIRRVLRRGSTAIVTTMKNERKHYWKPLVFDNHVREYSFDGLIEKATNSGLHVVHSFEFYKPLTTLARELQLSAWPTFKLPLLTLLINLPLGLLTLVGEYSKKPGGGIGLVLSHPTTECLNE